MRDIDRLAKKLRTLNAAKLRRWANGRVVLVAHFPHDPFCSGWHVSRNDEGEEWDYGTHEDNLPDVYGIDSIAMLELP